jgi:FkbM family methyltransferase
MFERLKGKIDQLRTSAAEVGPTCAARRELFRLRERLLRGVDRSQTDGYSLRVPWIPHPIWLRPYSSDADVFTQVFVSKQYSCIDSLRNPRLIFDCGANVGYASVYFLNLFPSARVIAIEPDPGNAAQCKRNLEPYGDRAVLIQAGLWPRRANLMVVRGEFADGREWATQVRECRDGEQPTVTGIDLNTLLEQYGDGGSIPLVKIDIEGAERYLFGGQASSWLRRVQNIAIELHGVECQRIFFESLASFDYDVSSFGELTVCRNLVERVAGRERAHG